jgi:hypothetical protein
MTDDLDDLFSPVESIDYGLGERIGRRPGYHYPAPPGEQPVNGNGWMRMSNLVSAFSDQERLQLWLTWKMMMGLRADDGLIFEEWMAEHVEPLSDDDQKKIANAFADRARDRAGAKDGARRGTAQHLVNETYLDDGVFTGTRTQQQRLQSALEALEACDLELIPGTSEERVWHPAAGGTMGTRDARVLCRRTGQVATFDWKTQLRLWTFQEVAGQMFGYDSAKWRWAGPPNDTGFWIPNEPGTMLGHPEGPFAGRPVALVGHMPRSTVDPETGREVTATHCEIFEVDLTYGRQVLEVAERNVELRSVGRSVVAGRCPGWNRPQWG